MISPRILVTRMDRLGDVLLALPVIERLRAQFPEGRIDFLCRPEIGEAISPYLEAKDVGLVASDGVLREKKYDAALYLFAPLTLVVQGLRAGIRLRVGSYSKPLSFILFNGGTRQHRSCSEKNEAEYNLELAGVLAARLGSAGIGFLPAPVEIPPTQQSVSEASKALSRLGLGSGDPFLVCHPGMGGSALNLSATNYTMLLDLIRARFQFPVVLTRGPAVRDSQLVDQITAIRRDYLVLDRVSLPGLREVFRKTRLVIAPSTGPLHLAHYVGARTIGIYSPVRSQRAQRWAPWGGTGASSVLYPVVECPGERDCLGSRCVEFSCMDRAQWSELLQRELARIAFLR